MRVKFLKDYDYTPSGERRTTTAYKAGMVETVKVEAGEEAIRLGYAELSPEVATRDDKSAAKDAGK